MRSVEKRHEVIRMTDAIMHLSRIGFQNIALEHLRRIADAIEEACNSFTEMGPVPVDQPHSRLRITP